MKSPDEMREDIAGNTLVILRAQELIGDLTACGDLLQSEASRVAEWVQEGDAPIPYEVAQAALAIGAAVQRWTEIRAHASLDPDG